MANDRLTALRAELKRRRLDGFVVPVADEHQNEFLPPHARRLAWLTGFTGSAGLAVVSMRKAAIFVDGRYTLQVRTQVDARLFEPHHLINDPPSAWIATHLRKGQRLGYDPWLHPPDAAERLAQACARAGAMLAPVDRNPIDAVWQDQPPPPMAPVVPHPLRYAGQPSGKKRRAIAAALKRAGADALVLSAPDSICWLLNVRGADTPNTPVVLAFAILHRDASVQLFVDPRKIGPATRRWLGGAVKIAPRERFGPALDRLKGKRVAIDPQIAPAWAAQRLAAAKASLMRMQDPCALPKACKNAAELAGARAAHVRDGAALVRFLAWLDGAVTNGGVTEVSAADRLGEFRAANPLFRGFSFDTISGAGPHGAIVHYRATAETDVPIKPGTVYLLDSGAQYLDGTTDVTRTMLVPGGRAADLAEARDRFTRVLKGHIALATARFPAGTSGGQLDSFARAALWQAGLDYDHGTGHGVGSYLGVHEGPQRVSKAASGVALRPGMIVSNEPGYYKTGAYGIRIENLVAVKRAKLANGERGRAMFEFETLTLAPIDRAMIAPALLDRDEKAWLNAYHARVRKTLSPKLDAQARKWLAAATRPI